MLENESQPQREPMTSNSILACLRQALPGVICLILLHFTCPIGAVAQEEWVGYRLSGEALKRFAAG